MRDLEQLQDLLHKPFAGYLLKPFRRYTVLSRLSTGPEAAIDAAVADGRRAFYTAPIKALSNQKYHDLAHRLGPHMVGLLTGDNNINADAPVVVMTTEVLRNMVYAGSATLGGLAGTLSALGGLLPSTGAHAQEGVPILGGLEEFWLATDAYIYGYPLVTMEYTRRALTNTVEPQGTQPVTPAARNMARCFPKASKSISPAASKGVVL